ncbi:SURF1 family protein, partial [Escherichia coli]|uniref:SURF1 family protein n=1 Tax=Escherichia coli TaxID=562 RepID=UPI0032E4D7C1
TEIRRVQQNYDKAPVPYEEARRSFDTSDPEAKWTTVSVRGQYIAEDQRIVRNRPNYSAAGYEIVVPFRLVSGETIIINRGWLPIGNNRPGYPDSVPAPPPGTVTAVVRIKPSEA